MLTINGQEILVDDLQEIETKLFNISEQLGSHDKLDDELGKAWYIVYKRLQKEKEKEAKMKIWKLNHC